MKLKFLVRTGPYSYQNIDTVYHLAKRAVKRGHEVFIFLYEDGTLNAQANIRSLEERNIAERVKELVDMGVRIGLCGTCAKFRGQNKKEIVEGVKFGGLALLVREMPDCDRFIVFGY